MSRQLPRYITQRVRGFRPCAGTRGDQRPWETPISVDTVGRSIKIAEYFRAHMVRLFVQRPNVRQILVLEWLRKKNAPDFVPRNLFRSVRRQFDESVETLNETLTELEQMGWIKKYSISTGGRDAKRYKVHPCLLAGGHAEERPKDVDVVGRHDGSEITLGSPAMVGT